MTTETPAFIDALPYIDTAIDDDEEQREIAMKEVDDETDVFAPERDYLEHLAPVEPRVFTTDLIEYELSCIESNQVRPSASDLDRIKTDVPPPASSVMDEEELDTWLSCLNQIKIKLEYKHRQMVNLESIKSNESIWKRLIAENTGIDSALKKELNDLNRRTQEVNWKRKSDQERVSKTLAVLRNEWESLVDKNRFVSEEIKKLCFKFDEAN